MTGKIKVLLPLLLIFLLVGCGKTNDGLTIEGHDWTYANAIDSEGHDYYYGVGALAKVFLNRDLLKGSTPKVPSATAS